MPKTTTVEYAIKVHIHALNLFDNISETTGSRANQIIVETSIIFCVVTHMPTPIAPVKIYRLDAHTADKPHLNTNGISKKEITLYIMANLP